MWKSWIQIKQHLVSIKMMKHILTLVCLNRVKKKSKNEESEVIHMTTYSYKNLSRRHLIIIDYLLKQNSLFE